MKMGEWRVKEGEANINAQASTFNGKAQEGACAPAPLRTAMLDPEWEIRILESEIALSEVPP
ncbi:MAG: hypothetical protein JSV00_08015 [bacterium]|nr:MAG: hypothetical protein JSV00_08015 [bacterium]